VISREITASLIPLMTILLEIVIHSTPCYS
jgi:hypothetical protein